MKKLFDLNNLIRLSLDEKTINGTKHYKWGLAENREAGKNDWVIDNDRKINFVARYNEATGLARDTTGEPFILDGCRPLIATINFALPNIPEIVLVDDALEKQACSAYMDYINKHGIKYSSADESLFYIGYKTGAKVAYSEKQLIEAMKFASSHLSSMNGIIKYIEQLNAPLEISELWLEWEEVPTYEKPAIRHSNEDGGERESDGYNEILKLKTSSDNKIKNAVVKFKEN